MGRISDSSRARNEDTIRAPWTGFCGLAVDAVSARMSARPAIMYEE